LNSSGKYILAMAVAIILVAGALTLPSTIKWLTQRRRNHQRNTKEVVVAVKVLKKLK
jgi:hypothetical protein